MKSQKGSWFDEESNEIDPYVFRLYISGASPNSLMAVANLKALFEKYLTNRYELQIIDIYQQPIVVKQVDIIALPLLIKKLPLPEKRWIGDMSNNDKILRGLNLEP